MNVRVLTALFRKRRTLRASERLPRWRLLQAQARALAALRQHAYAHSPFYREFHRNRYDAPLHELPVLSRRVMMDRFDDLVTDRTLRRSDLEAHLATAHVNESLGPYQVCASSGSTGTPAIFAFSFEEWIAVLASFERGTRWSGFRPAIASRRRVAAVTSTSRWHVSPRATRSTANWWVPVLSIDAAEPIATIVKRLNDWQPELLLLYPSVTRLLAAEHVAGTLRISPTIVLTGSESLTPATRTCIEQAWGVKPFDQYAAAEVGNIAAECEYHAGLHLFEDHVIVEVVDQHDRPVPVGSPGEKLLITVLFGRAQPLIRYELTDMIQLSTASCACGRTLALIDRVQGRSDEVLIFAGRSGGTVAVHPVLFERVLDRLPVVGWQLAHDQEGLTISVRGLREAFPEEVVIASLAQELAARGAIPPPIRIQRVSDTTRGPTSKAVPIIAKDADGPGERHGSIR